MNTALRRSRSYRPALADLCRDLSLSLSVTDVAQIFPRSGRGSARTCAAPAADAIPRSQNSAEPFRQFATALLLRLDATCCDAASDGARRSPNAREFATLIEALDTALTRDRGKPGRRASVPDR